MDTSETQSKEKRFWEMYDSQLSSQLTNAINLRSSQDQVLWSIFGTFWAANAILIVALFPNGDLPPNPNVGIVIESVGFFMCLIWYSIQNRALGHIKRHEALIAKLESRLNIDPAYAVSPKLNTELYKKFLNGCNARTVMSLSSVVGVIFWLVALSISLLNTSIKAILCYFLLGK